MTTALLGAGEFGDLVDLIIILVIIGASVLGPIAKGLIKHFGGKDPAEALKRRAERSSVPRLQPARPTYRPAKSMPERPDVRPPVAQVPLATPVAPGRLGGRRPLPVGRSFPVPAAPGPMASPASSSAGRIAPAATVVARPERDRSGPAVPERDLEESELSVEDADLIVEIPSEGAVRQRAATAEVRRVRPKTGGEAIVVRRPTRAALRTAIVMNEILGPPIALRPRDDVF